MINSLVIQNHKALKRAEMMGLGNINVICGKNNSGKTTILEALLKKECYGIGKKVDDADWLVGLFRPEAEKHNKPSPKETLIWFRTYMQKKIQENTIWYSHEKEAIVADLRQSHMKDGCLHIYGNDLYKFDSLISGFFHKSENFFQPILIPPKRQVEYQAIIELNQEITQTGNGILNKLFFLKNQDLNSDDYTAYKRVYETFFEITNSKFNVVPNRNNQIQLFFNTDNKNWVPAKDSGLGLSDILVIISIINLTDHNVILLEEPENHLHAAFQKRLLKYIRSTKSKQFFITTHSSVFLDTNMVDKIFYCSNNGIITLSDQTSKSEIINSLGYSVTENLVADLILLLEGPTDIPVIKEMLTWLEIDSAFNIKYWCLGGDNMAYLDLTVFAERNNVYALVDSDPGSSTQRTRFTRNCQDNGIYCKKLERYSIENYFTLEAIRKVFNDEIPEEIDKIHPNKSVDAQFGFKQNKSIKSKNYNIVKHMTLSDIEGTDLYSFLLDIKSFLCTDSLSVKDKVNNLLLSVQT